MKENLPKLLWGVLLLFVSSLSVKSQNLSGFTLSGIKGESKSVTQLLAEDAAAPKLPFAYRLKAEHETHRQMRQNPNALRGNSFTTFNDPRSVAAISATQTIHSNFLGVRVGDTPGWSPPDNNGDVGATQIAFTVNGRIRFYNKPLVVNAAVTTPTGTSNTEIGSPVFDIDSDVFFTNNALGITIGSDPHVRFDRITQRWFIVQIDISHSKNNYCQLAVSSGPTISNLASFTFYNFRVSATGGGSNKFFDYPTLGIDAKSLYIGGNMFGGSFAGCNMYVVDKAAMIAGTLTVTAFNQAATLTDMYTPQGVQNDDPNATEGFFIGSSQSVYGSILIRKITYSGSTPSISADMVFNTLATAAPVNPPNKGGGNLDALDDRPFAAMIRKNKITGVSTLWTANTTAANSSGVGTTGGDRDATIWYEFGTLSGTPTLLRSASYYDNAATNPRSYINGSVAMSGQGHCILSATTSGTNNYAQVTIAGRYRTDASTIFNAAIDATTTTSSYTGTRWGDYSQVVVDPLDDMTMWAFNQYTQGGNAWGTRAVQLKAPAPAAPALAATPDRGINNVTINGTSTNNTEFFDPGNDVGGPGYNRLNVTVTGPSAVAVSNIVFVSTTQITATFTIPANAVAGTYTVTVINPDGQTVTTTFVLPALPLPVSLVSFTGRLNNSVVELNWKTASEYNFKNYVVEKSADGSNFVNFSEVAPRGNANTAADYATVDRYPYPQYSYYRLKSVNTDGTFGYSTVVKIKTAQRKLSLTRLFPNPTATDVTFEMYADAAQAITVDVYDIAGKKMLSNTINLNAGINEKQVLLSRVADGAYFIQFKDAQNNVIEKVKIIKN
ncbi:hypothetical protein BH09BAC2_BH09BAC2_02280 [soil metagenome]